ncbi:MAG: exo-beta-1,3-glucanase (GH17 family) [Myxococcota bacterium]|jgi:exo-beta-1,3-glucanase (GH17 family)
MRTPSSLLLACAVGAGCAKPSTPASPTAFADWRQPPSSRIGATAVALAYSGYREGQHPDRGNGEVLPSLEQTREDLQLLVARGYRLIRLYDSGAQSQQVLRVIAEDGLPLTVMLGAWLQAEVSNHEGCEWLTEPIPEAELAANTTINAAEVARAIALAQAHPETIVAVNVGNEALVSWNDHMVTVDDLLAYVRQVQDAIDQPVSTADNYVIYVDEAAKLRAVLDFAMVHTYPQWEGKTIDEAMPYTLENLAAVHSAMPELPLAVGEAGWASAASEFGERANEADQARYTTELTEWAERANVTTFVFEAFDEPWKGNPNDPMGAEKHWGLYTVDRKPKQVLRDRD